MCSNSGNADFVRQSPEGGERLERMLRVQRLRIFKLLSAQRRRYGLESVYWFTWRDSAPATGGAVFCETAGLFTDTYQPKPAWAAFASAAGGTP